MTKKGKVRADMITKIGPLLTSFAISKLGPTFTFEEFLGEVDQLLEKAKY